MKPDSFSIEVGKRYRDLDPREKRVIVVCKVTPERITIHNVAHKNPNTTTRVRRDAFLKRFVPERAEG